MATTNPIAREDGVREPRTGLTPQALIRSLGTEEQLRFHVDVGKCIGCNACMVACNEQHGNPADIFWRRVGECEVGIYPHARRLFTSMACNHCLDPACLAGCPTNAYVKDEQTGIVRHLDNECIGCEYCVWNCPYTVPQYDKARHIVTKCDMGFAEMMNDQWPACVSTCPTGALSIEPVSVREWRERPEPGDAPGLPPVRMTYSTTRFSFPGTIHPPADSSVRAMRPVAQNDGQETIGHSFAVRFRLGPEKPHFPLVLFTVLTQMSIGALLILWIGRLRSDSDSASGNPFLVPLSMVMLSLVAATLHLGRPLRAHRALRNWRHSWLSREIASFGAFAAMTTGTLLLPFLQPSIPLLLLRGAEGCSVLLGFVSLYCTARIYRVPARPAWDTPRTTISFLLTSFLLGPALAGSLAAFLTAHGAVEAADFAVLCSRTIVGGASALLALEIGWLVWTRRDPRREIRGTRSLLFTDFLNHAAVRHLLLIVGGVLLPIGMSAQAGPLLILMSLLMLLSSELLGRYLFFVTVVPMAIPGTIPGTPFRQRVP